MNGRAKSAHRAQSVLDLFSGPCLNGGARSNDPGGVMTFDGCLVFPGIELRGGVRIIPAPDGAQGGRIDFYDLEVRSDGRTFRIDGSIEEEEDEQGGLTFRFDLRSSSEDGEYNDEFNVRGEMHVTEDGEVFGDLQIDTGDKYDYQRPSRCRFDGQDLFGIIEDPDTFESLCPEDSAEPFAAADPPIDDDPFGVQLAANVFAEIEDSEPALSVLEPSDQSPNTLFGLEFVNARVYAQMDAVGYGLTGFTVEDAYGRYLYTFKNHYRGVSLTLATGDVMRLDLSSSGDVNVEMTLNSTSPPSRISFRIDAEGNGLLNTAGTRLHPDPNPDYASKLTQPPAKTADRSAGIRLSRESCKSILGGVRSTGAALCDLKDLFTGEAFERAGEAVCQLSKAAVQRLAQSPEAQGAANLSLTVLCTAAKTVGLGGKIISSLTPAEIGCKILSISSDLSLANAGQELEATICSAIGASGDWFVDRVEIVGFINADGVTEETSGASPDARIIPYGPDSAHPIFEWAPHLVPRAEYVILTAEQGGQQELYYWLTRDRRALPSSIRYGHYNYGKQGVSNAPYPAPPLLELPSNGFYRLRIRLEDGVQLETRFRMVDSRDGVLFGKVQETVGSKKTYIGNQPSTEPVAGARVKALGPGGSVLGEALSDENGDYRIERLAPGAIVTLRAEIEGYAAGQMRFELPQGETQRNVNVAPLNPACSSDTGLVELISGSFARELVDTLLIGDNASGYEPSGMMICVGGNRSHVAINWADSWVASYMRAIDADHLGERSDAELRVVGVRLVRWNDGVPELVAQKVNYGALPPPVMLEFDDERILLESGAEYGVQLDIFVGDLIVITSEPRLRFRAR